MQKVTSPGQPLLDALERQEPIHFSYSVAEDELETLRVRYAGLADGTTTPGFDTVTYFASEQPQGEEGPADVLEVRGTFWVSGALLSFVVGGGHSFEMIDFSHAGPEMANNLEAIARALEQRNLAMGFERPAQIESSDFKLSRRQIRGLHGETARADSSQLGQALGHNLARLRDWAQEEGYRIHFVEGKAGRFGVGSRLPGAAWEVLKHNPAIVLKIWHAIEAYRFETGNPLGPFTISPEHILRAIKGSRQSKYLAEERREAADLLDALIQLQVQFHWKDRQGQLHRTSGPLYLRSLSDESYEDLFGYIPNASRLVVNPDLFDDQGAVFARMFAPYHKNFLSLNAQKDQGAIFLGSFIILKGRAQSKQYEPGECRFRVRTLVNVLHETRTIDLRGYAQKRQLHQVQTKVERDLDKLVAAGVISSWCYLNQPEQGGEDLAPDDLESIEKLFPSDLPPSGEKRRRRGPDGELRRGSFFDWMEGTFSIMLGQAAIEAQVGARSSLEAKRKMRKPRRQASS